MSLYVLFYGALYWWEQGISAAPYHSFVCDCLAGSKAVG